METRRTAVQAKNIVERLLCAVANMRVEGRGLIRGDSIATWTIRNGASTPGLIFQIALEAGLCCDAGGPWQQDASAGLGGPLGGLCCVKGNGGGGRVGSRSGFLNQMSSLELSWATLEPTLPGDPG